jgi:hypothetical protein
MPQWPPLPSQAGRARMVPVRTKHSPSPVKIHGWQPRRRPCAIVFADGLPRLVDRVPLWQSPPDHGRMRTTIRSLESLRR